MNKTELLDQMHYLEKMEEDLQSKYPDMKELLECIGSEIVRASFRIGELEGTIIDANGKEIKNKTV